MEQEQEEKDLEMALKLFGEIDPAGEDHKTTYSEIEQEEKDFALALKLFGEIDPQGGGQKAKSSENHNSKKLSIVDPSWEMIDPVPNIRELFFQFNGAYFDGLLACVEVKWSTRMTQLVEL